MVRRLLPLMLALAAPALAEKPPQSPSPPKGAVAGTFLFPARPVWAGQVFDLKLAWRVDWDLFRALEGDPVWTADPLAAEDWTRDPPGKPAPEGGRSIATLTLSTRAMALQPGTVKLKPLRQQMQLVTGGYETDGVKIATIGEASALSAGATLTVRPLPPAPPGFAGAVGDFTLSSSTDHKDAEAGKPIAWTLTMAGTGNWVAFGGVPSRPLPHDFDMVGQPKVREEKGNSLFERTVSETITIMPRKAGHYTLGPIELPVFDPVIGTYKTIAAPALTLDVKPGPAGAEPPAYEAEPDAIPPGEPLPPPLAGTGHAWAPLQVWAWRTALALPFAALAMLWLALAWARARAADPERLSRKAHARLARTLAALAVATDEAERRALVRAWQRDAGVRLKIAHAAPSAAAFDAEWERLWDEAELYLYARAVPLPDDWTARAQAALDERGAPAPFDPRTIFAARNLYPVAALLCALVAASPALLPAADRATLQQRLETSPRDWIARYDLALAEASTKRWPAAAAMAGIAWVQAPRSAEAAALWTRTAREAGFGGRTAGGLPLSEDGRGPFTGLLAPAEWQAATFVLLLIAAGGGATLLLRRFGRAPRRAALPALIASGIGIAGTLTGLAGLDGYGIAAAADAAIVYRQVPLRTLPVDTPDDEAPITLAPGTAGRIGAPFMGWVKLTLADGRSGWLRREQVLPLWRGRP